GGHQAVVDALAGQDGRGLAREEASVGEQDHPAALGDRPAGDLGHDPGLAPTRRAGYQDCLSARPHGAGDQLYPPFLMGPEAPPGVAAFAVAADVAVEAGRTVEQIALAAQAGLADLPAGAAVHAEFLHW